MDSLLVRPSIRYGGPSEPVSKDVDKYGAAAVRPGQAVIYTIDSIGVHRPDVPVTHRNDEYDQAGFASLLEMQAKHFWYLGRHRFLLAAFKKFTSMDSKSVIDLGGGVGGWVQYLHRSCPNFEEIGLGDSSEVALRGAKTVLPPTVDLYQVDLMNLGWKSRWDIISLLDVIEHCPDDEKVLEQVYEALKPGGLLFVTTPALMHFWSFIDEYSHHHRRYNIRDYARLADRVGLELVDTRYFMFLLSPLYWLSRKLRPKPNSEAQIALALSQEQKMPSDLANSILTYIFYSESILGQSFRFPWGTSILGVFRKPS